MTGLAEIFRGQQIQVFGGYLLGQINNLLQSLWQIIYVACKFDALQEKKLGYLPNGLKHSCYLKK